MYNILQVCNYHQQFYRPENLCVIITGQIDPNQVFETVKPSNEPSQTTFLDAISKILIL